MKTGETIRLGLLLMLMAVSLGGCLDYRAGRHWVADGDREWVRVDKSVTLHGSTFESPYMVWAQQTCSSTVTVEIQKSAEGSTHSLFLVPILPGDSVGNPAKTSIVVRGPGLSAGCWNGKEPRISIEANGMAVPDAQVSSCKKSEACCYVDVPRSRETLESLMIAIDGPDGRCAYPPLVLRSTRHMCLRGTRFGGSESCSY